MSLLSLLLLASVPSSGCLVVALQPGYDAESVVFEEALLGAWENADDGVKAAIDRGEWRSYKITYSDRSTTRTFQGNLTKIGSTSFLDLTEMRGADPGPFLVPVHCVVRVTIAGDTVAVAQLDYAWFTRALKQRTGAMPPLALDDRRNVVMMSPTNEIRRWLTRAPDAAFSAPMTFKRAI